VFNQDLNTHSKQLVSERQPVITIGMPVFNCAKTVALAVSSILNQTFTDWELLVIDDGSRDNTSEIAASFGDPRIIVTRSYENKRLPTRLNECVDRARGKYFARMDGDDIAYPGRLECQLDFLQSHPEVDLVGGWVVVFRNDGTAFGARRSPLEHDQICARPWQSFSMPHPTWTGRIEWFRRNRYHPVDASEDQELLSRTYRNSTFAAVPNVVLGYREDSLSLSYILFQRWHVCKRNIKNAGQQGRLMAGALGVVGQVLRGGLDIVAVCTGLKYRLLRHRAPAIRAEEDREWRSVWEQVHGIADALGSKRIVLAGTSSDIPE
jgi:hypothetical protein